MNIYNDSITIDTKSKFELININSQISRIIKESSITNGLINISTRHTTSAIIINEDEEHLKRDIKYILEKVVGEDNYEHDLIDNNASSHLRSLLLTPTQTLPIIDKSLSLGIWQSIFFVELDGPRSKRQVNIMIIGD
ncbi:MAG: secondary thiamine-phosphate synthase enzyme YjbQ [Methanosphaera sp.]|nr:secondary thiamine-phosphate synthase enzyme YjbQ [Methanosphaera sp.]